VVRRKIIPQSLVVHRGFSILEGNCKRGASAQPTNHVASGGIERGGELGGGECVLHRKREEPQKPIEEM